jgi:hypothetical protein
MLAAGKPGGPQVIGGVTITAGLAALGAFAVVGIIMLLKKNGFWHYLIGAVLGGLTVLSMSGHVSVVTKFFTTKNSMPVYITAGLLALLGVVIAFVSGPGGAEGGEE